MLYKKGFTLIELLVVISIIGLLASVVLASLNSARNKANNATVKNELSSIRAQAALYYDTHNGSYGIDFYPGGFPPVVLSNCKSTAEAVGTLFGDDPNIIAMITQAGNAATGLTGASAMAAGLCGVRSSPASWIVIMPLKENTDTTPFTGPDSSFVGWCADSTGKSEQISGTGWTGAGVSSTMTTCP